MRAIMVGYYGPLPTYTKGFIYRPNEDDPRYGVMSSQRAIALARREIKTHGTIEIIALQDGKYLVLEAGKKTKTYFGLDALLCAVDMRGGEPHELANFVPYWEKDT